MSNLKTALAMENEIFKATDFNFGYDSIISNIATAMKAVLSGSEGNYVIGGKVTPYGSGGLNVSIGPVYGFCNTTGVVVVESEITEPVSFEEASDSLDRIDIIEICGEETGYDSQLRKFIDPSTGLESTQTVNTKKKIALKVVVKKGSNGSESAPAVDSGYIKIAEVRIPAGTNNITEDLIKNIDARKHGINNTEWTTNASATFNPSYLANIFHTFLENHNEDGSHKDGVVKSSNIDFGTGSSQVKGALIPSGQSTSVHGVEFTSQESVTSLIVALAENTNSLYKYANDILSRFSLLEDFPVACSTVNVDIEAGGEMTIDGVSCTIGQLVFLKDQTNKRENGFYEVQSGAWNRYTGYGTDNPEAFKSKLIFVKDGTENDGKIFYLADDLVIIGRDDLIFTTAILSPSPKPYSLVIRDENGRIKASEPESDNDVVRKKEHDELKKIIDEINTGEIGVNDGKYTYTVDSQEKFDDWVNNVQKEGQSYAHVAVVGGPYTADKELNLDAIGTKTIDGFLDATLSFTGQYGIRDAERTTDDYYIRNLKVIISNETGSATAFESCRNLINCMASVSCNNIPSNDIGACGFHNCKNMFSCTSVSNANEESSSENFGISKSFSGCANLVNCNGKAMGISCRVFTECANLVNCNGIANSENEEAIAFSHCSLLTGCTGEGYISEGSSSSQASAAGFSSCVDLTNCDGVGINNNNKITSTGHSGGAGFLHCDNLFGCSGFGYCYTSGLGFGYKHCNRLGECESFYTHQGKYIDVGFDRCNYLTGCYSYGERESVGFFMCNFLGNCHSKSNPSFEFCTNLTNCQAELNPNASGSYVLFDACKIMINCRGICTGSVQYGSAIVFKNCEDLNNCIGETVHGPAFEICKNISGCKGKDEYSVSVSGGPGYAFYQCKGVLFCGPSGHSGGGVFYNCSANQGEYDATYAVANTPTGGFNNTTNPSA